MRTQTLPKIALALLLPALAGCEKGSGPTTTPEDGAAEGEVRESDAPEEVFPDDEDVEDEDQPY